jgi:hypothetical protein
MHCCRHAIGSHEPPLALELELALDDDALELEAFALELDEPLEVELPPSEPPALLLEPPSPLPPLPPVALSPPELEASPNDAVSSEAQDQATARPITKEADDKKRAAGVIARDHASARRARQAVV